MVRAAGSNITGGEMIALAIVIGLVIYAFLQAMVAASAPGVGGQTVIATVPCLGAVFGAMYIVAQMFAY